MGFPVILIAALAAARLWASGRDPSYTSWADPSTGRRVAGSTLAAPPHAHHCSCGIWAQGPEGQAASLPLPPDPWVLVLFYGGLALGAWATQPTSLAAVISWVKRCSAPLLPPEVVGSQQGQLTGGHCGHLRFTLLPKSPLSAPFLCPGVSVSFSVPVFCIEEWPPTKGANGHKYQQSPARMARSASHHSNLNNRKNYNVNNYNDHSHFLFPSHLIY